MQEIHAYSNGDGTYSAEIIAVLDGIPHRFHAEEILIKADQIVLDEDQMTKLVRFTFSQRGMSEQ